MHAPRARGRMWAMQDSACLNAAPKSVHTEVVMSGYSNILQHCQASGRSATRGATRGRGGGWGR
eukprot:6213061-Pleurochrysis_carterae.AAC.3